MTRRGTHLHVLLSCEDFGQVISQEREKAAQQLTLFAIDDYAGRVVYVDDAIKFTGWPRAGAIDAEASTSNHADSAPVRSLYAGLGQREEVPA